MATITMAVRSGHQWIQVRINMPAASTNPIWISKGSKKGWIISKRTACTRLKAAPAVARTVPSAAAPVRAQKRASAAPPPVVQPQKRTRSHG